MTTKEKPEAKKPSTKKLTTEEVRALAPRDELDILIREAIVSVETELALDDRGWINLSTGTGEIIKDAQRIVNMKVSRYYAIWDPMGRQAIRLWTDYTFGSGMTWQTEDEKAKMALEGFWNARANRKILGAAGQRKSSNKLLIDGEIYFAIFLGAEGKATIRRIDPLEISEIITDPDDKEAEKFYVRKWTDRQSHYHTTIYRSIGNKKGTPFKNSAGQPIRHDDDALVYRLEYNDRNPLLLPALIWMKYHTKFLASRLAVMLALAKFAWRTKVKGGQTLVDALKAKTHQQDIPAGSHLLENLGSDTTPIKTETGARAAYQDGRMIKLQIAAAVGIPEQYFGDISIGNLATAKTVELPMMKMFQSYQKVWSDAYRDIEEIVLAHNNVPEANWYVDRGFPPIAPADVAATAQAIVSILTVMPELAYSDDVQQIALMTLGVNDPAEVIEELAKEVKKNPEAALLVALKVIRESIQNKEKKE